MGKVNGLIHRVILACLVVAFALALPGSHSMPHSEYYMLDRPYHHHRMTFKDLGLDEYGQNPFCPMVIGLGCEPMI